MSATYGIVGGTTKKQNKFYGIVSALTKKITKLYAIVGGLTKCIFSAEMSYYGTATALSVGRCSMGSGNIGNYALFAGGYNSSGSRSAVVDAYNSSLFRSTATSLSLARTGLDSATAKVGNYLIVAGGQTDSGMSKVVDAYDTSLVRSIPTQLGDYADNPLCGTAGNYAVVGCENNGSVYAYDASLTLHYTNADTARQVAAGSQVGNYFLIAGGNRSGNASDMVTSYDASLTMSWSVPKLSVARMYLKGTYNSKYALFAGGRDASYNRSNIVDAYDASLVRYTPTVLTLARTDIGGLPSPDYAVFAGGDDDGNYDMCNNVEAYDTDLVRHTYSLSQARYQVSGAYTGGYGIIAGGWSSPLGRVSTADVFSM